MIKDLSCTSGNNVMTIKEVAEVFKKEESTIRKIAKELFPGIFKNGVKTFLDEKQVTLIKLNLGKNSELIKTNLEKELLIMQAMGFQQEKITNMQAEIDNKNLLIELQAPKVEYYEKVLDSKSCFTTTQLADELNMSAIKLNKILCVENIQYKQSNQYHLYAKYKNKGYDDVRTAPFTHKDGSIGTRHYLVWTEKGREFILKELIND